jgi:hypothetical protein
MVPDYFQTLLQYASYRLAGPEDKGAETMGGRTAKSGRGGPKSNSSHSAGLKTISKRNEFGATKPTLQSP